MTALASQENKSEKVGAYLEKIDTSSKFLLELINDILDMACIERGRVDLHPQNYPMDEFKSLIFSTAKVLAEKKNIHFCYVPDSSVDCIYVDRLRFNQIILNLLSNAVKFTPDGGTVTLTWSVMVLNLLKKSGCEVWGFDVVQEKKDILAKAGGHPVNDQVEIYKHCDVIMADTDWTYPVKNVQSLLGQTKLQAVFVNPLSYMDTTGMKWLRALQPPRVVIYHVPYEGEDKSGLRRLVNRELQSQYLVNWDLLALTEPMQTENV